MKLHHLLLVGILTVGAPMLVQADHHEDGAAEITDTDTTAAPTDATEVTGKVAEKTKTDKAAAAHKVKKQMAKEAAKPKKGNG